MSDKIIDYISGIEVSAKPEEVEVVQPFLKQYEKFVKNILNLYFFVIIS